VLVQLEQGVAEFRQALAAPSVPMRLSFSFSSTGPGQGASPWQPRFTISRISRRGSQISSQKSAGKNSACRVQLTPPTPPRRGRARRDRQSGRDFQNRRSTRPHEPAGKANLTNDSVISSLLLKSPAPMISCRRRLAGVVDFFQTGTTFTRARPWSA